MNALLLDNVLKATTETLHIPSYDVFSNFREALSLNSLKDFFVTLFKGIFTFSCSESVLQSLLTLRVGVDVCNGNGVCWASDFLYFLGWTTAVATIPEVLNFWTLGASMVLVVWIIGFLIFALELFVFLASCEIMSAVSTSRWNVDLLQWKLWTLINYSRCSRRSSPFPLALPDTAVNILGIDCGDNYLRLSFNTFGSRLLWFLRRSRSFHLSNSKFSILLPSRQLLRARPKNTSSTLNGQTLSREMD